jgi:hypothetical protein
MNVTQMLSPYHLEIFQECYFSRLFNVDIFCTYYLDQCDNISTCPFKRRMKNVREKHDA